MSGCSAGICDIPSIKFICGIHRATKCKIACAKERHASSTVGRKSVRSVRSRNIIRKHPNWFSRQRQLIFRFSVENRPHRCRNIRCECPFKSSRITRGSRSVFGNFPSRKFIVRISYVASKSVLLIVVCFKVIANAKPSTIKSFVARYGVGCRASNWCR